MYKYGSDACNFYLDKHPVLKENRSITTPLKYFFPKDLIFSRWLSCDIIASECDSFFAMRKMPEGIGSYRRELLIW